MPGFFKGPVLYNFIWLSSESAKIEFLKAEYKKFLNHSKKQILSNHFRHYRTFKPNELDASLLRHKLSYLLPDNAAFKAQMDEPTRVIVEYLKQKITHFQEKYDEFIVNKLQSLAVFNKQNFDNYHGESHGGWHTVIIDQTSPEQKKEYRVMALLLPDRDKYDCQY